MMIELIGPAGIGKTTAACGAEDILRARGVDVLGFDERERLESEIGTRSVRRCGFWGRAHLITGLLCRRPDITLPILLLPYIYGPEISSGSSKSRRRRARRVLGHVRMALALKKLAAGRLVLLDEGFTQVLWTMLIDSPSLRARWLIRFLLGRYHAAIGQRGIRFVVDDEIVAERAFAREANSRFSKDSAAAWRQGYGRWLDFHRDLVALMPASLTATRLVMSGAKDVGARRLVEAIDDLGSAAVERQSQRRAAA